MHTRLVPPPCATRVPYNRHIAGRIARSTASKQHALHNVHHVQPLRPRRSNPASATTNHPPSHRTVHMHAHRDAPSNVPRARECTSHSSQSIHPSGPLRRRDIPLCPHGIAITAITAITAAAAAAMCPRPPRLHAPQHAPPAPPSDPPAAAIPCLGARGSVLTARGRAGCRWGGHAPS